MAAEEPNLGLLAKLYLASQAVALDNSQRGRRIVERLMLKTQDGTLGQPATPETAAIDAALGEDMAVNVGNTFNITVPAEPTAQAAPAAPGSSAAAPQVMTGGAVETARETVQKAAEVAKKVSPWVKAALYAGLIAAGGGAGVGIPALFGAFSKAAPAAAAVKSALNNVPGWELVTEPKR